MGELQLVSVVHDVRFSLLEIQHMILPQACNRVCTGGCAALFDRSLFAYEQDKDTGEMPRFFGEAIVTDWLLIRAVCLKIFADDFLDADVK